MNDDELIKKWRNQRSQSAYNTLKRRHTGMVMQAVNRYAAANIPRQSLEAKAWTLFDDAVQNYKINTNAKFSTYLTYQLKKLDRHTKKHQNIARIPETLSGRIGDYNRANQQLGQKLKRQPTHHELADHLKMPVTHVKRLSKSLRGDLYEGKFEGTEFDQQNTNLNWLLIELRDELTMQEKLVYDHLIGYKKQKITNKQKLAKKLNLTPGRISQITKNISKKIQPHLNRRF